MGENKLGLKILDYDPQVLMYLEWSSYIALAVFAVYIGWRLGVYFKRKAEENAKRED